MPYCTARQTSIAAAKSSIAVPTDLNSVIWLSLVLPLWRGHRQKKPLVREEG